MEKIHTLHVSFSLVNDKCVATMRFLLFLLWFSLNCTAIMSIGHNTYLAFSVRARKIQL